MSAAPQNFDVHCDKMMKRQFVQCARTRWWQTTCWITASSSTSTRVRGATEKIWITTATVGIAGAGSTAMNVGRNGIRRRNVSRNYTWICVCRSSRFDGQALPAMSLAEKVKGCICAALIMCCFFFLAFLELKSYVQTLFKLSIFRI